MQSKSGHSSYGPLWIVGTCGVAVLLLSGCGGPPARSSISGIVKLDDKVVKGGSIKLKFKTGEILQARINGNGGFAMPQGPIGEATAAVETESVKGAAKGAAPPGVGTSTGKVEGLPKDETPKEEYVKIPAKYNSVDQSGLTFNIKPGQQTISVEMKSN
jgi:hypothetical protein